ncbi:hypothetical protein TCAL_15732, partial [Tigriopus californicus]
MALLTPGLNADEDYIEKSCLNFVRISSLKDLEAVNFTNPVLLKDHDNLDNKDIKALQVSCLQGEHFASEATDVNQFLTNFQKLRIFAKPFVNLHANLSGQRVESINDMQRTFDLVTPNSEEEEVHEPPKVGSRQLIFNFFEFWPSLFLDDDGILRGVDLHVVETLAQKFRFTYKFLPPGFSIDARELPNGTIVGVRPDVETGVSDLATAQFTISHERFKTVDYAPTMSEHDITLTGAKAKPRQPYEALVLPFDLHIWIGLSVTLLVSFLMLTFFKIFIDDSKSVWSNMYNAWSLAVSPLLQESLPVGRFQSHHYLSLHVFMYLWLGFCLILTLAYKSNLLATMTMDVMEDVIDSPEEVLESGLPVYVVSNSMIEISLVGSPLEVFRDIYKYNVVPYGTAFPISKLPPEMDPLVDSGKAFFASTRATSVPELNRFAFKQSIYVGASSWVGPKGSRIVRLFSDPILRIQGGGFLNKWYQDELGIILKNEAAVRKQARHEKIDMAHMLPLFILTSISLSLCSL